MMDKYPACTEFPEDVWKTSGWFPQLLVGKRLRQLAEEGKPLPSESVVNNVLTEMIRMIKENNGLSQKAKLDFEPVLKGLEKE